MPLVRVEVRNEYGLGTPELYKAADPEDPKALLDGVTVAGLVGILRQLGDLAEFAAEVFHGLQEQVMITSSRSQKLILRLQNMEAELPPIEKAILAQRSHLHFAYTTGTNWHPRLQNPQNLFIYGDLPRFIMDSYEGCREPPRLHLLDKFDAGGPGSCIKRYSDPTFFKKASAVIYEVKSQKVTRDGKTSRVKKRRSRHRNGERSRSASSRFHGSMQFVSQQLDGRNSSQVARPFNVTLKSDGGARSDSSDSRTGSGFIECIFHPNYSTESEAHEPKESLCTEFHKKDDVSASPKPKDDVTASLKTKDDVTASPKTKDDATVSSKTKNDVSALPKTKNDVTALSKTKDDVTALPKTKDDVTLSSTSGYGKTGEISKTIEDSSPQDQCCLSSCAWDEKTEIVELAGQRWDHDENSEAFLSSLKLDTQERGDMQLSVRQCDHAEKPEMPSAILKQDIQGNGDCPCEVVDQGVFRYDDMDVTGLSAGGKLHDNIESETDNYVDALNFIESESETDVDCQTKHEVEHLTSSNNREMNDKICTTEVTDLNSLTETHVAAVKSADKVIFGNDSNMLSEETKVVNLPNEETAQDNNLNNTMAPECCSHLQALQIDDKICAIEDKDPNPLCSETHFVAEKSADDVIFRNDFNMLSEETKVIRLPSEETLTDNSLNNTVAPEYYSHLQALQIDGQSPKPRCLQDMDLPGSVDWVDISNIDIPSYVSKEPTSYSITNDEKIGICEAPEPLPDSTSSNSVKFWTNGGLLGLEPSKPPDFSFVNVCLQDSLVKSRNDIDSPSGRTDNFRKGNEMSHNLVNGSKIIEEGPYSKCSTSYKNDQEDTLSCKKISGKPKQASIDTTLETSCALSEKIRANDSHTDSFYAKIERRQRTDSEDGSNVQATQVGMEDCKSSSRMFDLSNRFLVSGLQKKLFLGVDKNCDPSSSMSTTSLEPKGPQTVRALQQNVIGRTKELFQYGSHGISPPPSPPLVHMRMSFQPTDGFETFKLKLRFPDASNSLKSCEDLFPSFQLVPESALPLHDTGSDSDDDTFSRSPYMSDDCLSHLSGSNSGHWDSDDSPCCGEPQLVSYMEMRREANDTNCYLSGISCSISENDFKFSNSSALPDLPTFDALDLSRKSETAKASEFEKLFECGPHKEPTPPPPPLLPAQWLAMNLNPDVEAEKQDNTYEYLHHISNSKLLEPAVSHQAKGVPVGLDCITEASDATKNRTNDFVKQRLNDHKEAQGGDTMDDKEDFLNQIREKSFNLRPIVVDKPTVKPGPPSNTNVSAILKKANAIRQVVASDDGEDDESWSDT